MCSEKKSIQTTTRRSDGQYLSFKWIQVFFLNFNSFKNKSTRSGVVCRCVVTCFFQGQLLLVGNVFTERILSRECLQNGTGTGSLPVALNERPSFCTWWLALPIRSFISTRTVNAVALTKGMVSEFACPFRIRRQQCTSASLYYSNGERTDVSMCQPTNQLLCYKENLVAKCLKVSMTLSSNSFAIECEPPATAVPLRSADFPPTGGAASISAVRTGGKKFLKVGHIFSLGVCWRTWAAAMTMRAAGSLEFHHTKQHFRGYFKNYLFKLN